MESELLFYVITSVLTILTLYLALKQKSGNWKTVKIRSSLLPCQGTTGELDFMLWISIFAATEFFFTETMLENKLSDIKTIFFAKNFSHNQNSFFNLTSQKFYYYENHSFISL